MTNFAGDRRSENLFLDSYYQSLYDKKELDVYHRVPGSSDQKTDFGRFGEHPRPGRTSSTEVVRSLSKHEMVRLIEC